MDILRFENPKLLWLLLLLAPMTAYYLMRLRQGGATIRLSTVAALKKVSKGWMFWLRHVPFVLRMAAVAAVVVAIARPQTSSTSQSVTAEGIDIMIALDISGSMLAADFEPNRIEAAKKVASQFILDRPADRIGLAVFAGESFTQCPMTTDHATLINLLGQVQMGMIADGTAIGDGLATAVNRLKGSQAKSKVIILLTDGVNNRGRIAPLTGADLAKTFGIRVYTIGVGKKGLAPYPAYNMWGELVYANMPVEIDEQVLEQIAADTGGEYFRATDNNTLEEVYDKINELEKSKVEVENYVKYHELFQRFALIALALLAAELLFRYLVLRKTP